jgi:hypothetical protein
MHHKDTKITKTTPNDYRFGSVPPRIVMAWRVRASEHAREGTYASTYRDRRPRWRARSLGHAKP